MTGLAGAVEPTLGQALRDAALWRVQNRIPAGDTWRRAAVEKIADLASTGQPFEAYDVVREGVAEPDHPSRWGALFNLCARQGLIESAGAGPSSRPTVKASLCRFWRGAP